MRYLIMEDFSGQPIAFLFPDRVDHVDMRDQLPYGTVLSAGNVVIEGGKLLCSGGCVELGISSRPKIDASIIESALR